MTDPRALDLPARAAAAQRLHREQAHWLPRVRTLLAPQRVDDDFPAFLLASPTFAGLAQRLARAQRRSDLATETADELEWFVQAFADYLRTRDGEDVFAGGPARRC